ncbi:MAG: HlyD family efflux transporter periplasmic adaptor subunit [Alphaproteobacteria bacterium]|nr:HlyD family efflux transporter periplasmic adaptor subunit [Alphaproteobacteria bacterium]
MTRLLALPRRAMLVAGAAVALIVAGGAWIAMPASSVSTDDAYLKADSTVVAPRVHGLIAEILVHDNQQVKQGQPLLRIDTEEYEQEVAAANADVAAARAALDQQGAQEALASANANAASAAIRAADAERVRAAADDRRFETLVKSGDVSLRQAEQMHATAKTAAADADRSRATYAASREQLSVIAKTRGTLEASLAKAKAALGIAEMNLRHALISSPIDGVVGDRQVQTGEYVQPGTQLMTIVPLHSVYVQANYKETQTSRMLAGQRATISIDALPGHDLQGRVESFAPGSGSEFSLLPFEPATGNFTRVVQRVPVRIHLDPGQKGLDRLRPGLSAKVTVQLAQR